MTLYLVLESLRPQKFVHTQNSEKSLVCSSALFRKMSPPSAMCFSYTKWFQCFITTLYNDTIITAPQAIERYQEYFFTSPLIGWTILLSPYLELFHLKGYGTG